MACAGMSLGRSHSTSRDGEDQHGGMSAKRGKADITNERANVR
jgi:hypothetical protein